MNTVANPVGSCLRQAALASPGVPRKIGRLSRDLAVLRQSAVSEGRCFTSANSPSAPHVVIAGCGVAGASAAMHLARRGVRVSLVDPRPPLTATSQYSTECYRNFFLDPLMVPFMSRSIDLLESLAGDDNPFQLNRKGYCFITASEKGMTSFEEFAAVASGFGAGPVREHRDASSYLRSPEIGFQHPDMVGFDLVYGSQAIREIFPFVTDQAVAMLHARRCGWMDAQGLGQTMLREAKARSAQVLRGTVQGFDISSGAVSRVHVLQNDGVEASLHCDAFINAAGAWTKAISTLLAPDEPLPLSNEVHAKVILNDTLGTIPQDSAPFMVWRDAVTLEFDEDTQDGLDELDDTGEGGIINSKCWKYPQPGGQHLRPAGNGRVLMLWEHFHRHIDLPEAPSMPVEEFLDMYPELCLGGLKVMVPGLGQYEGRLGRDTIVDGGYYTVTSDSRPLIGSYGASNAFVCSGMGTYGLMASPAAGELASQHVLGDELPEYAGAFTWPRQSSSDEKPIDLLDDSA